ncbi:MAG: peptidylprolyl isomerase [Chloroflexi bacterium]|nr:peptidylprolyl isomerase [Chloroflexota bacterium]
MRQTSRLLGLLLLLGTAACGGGGAAATPTPGLSATPVAASTTFPTGEPSPTPIPLAATVNGQPIPLADYEAEIARFEAGAASLGRDPGAEGDYHTLVLNALIEKTILLQAAVANVTASDADVQAAYDQALAARGGQAEFETWLAANLYTPDQFRAELRDGILINALQTQIAAGVPAEMGQVHARHILVATQAEAEQILTELGAGADFATLAVNRSLDQSSRVNGGDLGWFPQTGLVTSEVAQAAFALQPDQTSGIIQSGLGFHIVQTIERGMHPLTAGVLAELQRQAIQMWLADLKAKAVIENLVRP